MMQDITSSKKYEKTNHYVGLVEDKKSTFKSEM